MDLGLIINALFAVHPWHILAVHFPIGLTGAALLFVVLARWRGSEWLEHAAYFTLTLSVAGTILAGLTGLRDSIVRYGGAPLADQKIFLALSLLVLSTIVVLSRRRQRNLLWQPSTVILYVAGYAGCFGLAAILGFVGGTIIYGV
jgi:uncharacterized membrane protein